MTLQECCLQGLQKLKWTGLYLLKSTGILEVTMISNKATITFLFLGTPPDHSIL